MTAREANRQNQFELLIIEHHVRLRAFIRSLGVDPDWVDDIAQEAFLIAYRDQDTFDETRDFGKWLRGIAANLVRNEIRKDARRRRILHTELSELLLQQYSTSQEKPEPVTLEAIRHCVDKLSPKSRDVVERRYREGESASDIAHVLALTADNVRQMLVRIRRQIKQCVELQLTQEV